MSRPNILYINSHDTGRYIQPHGHAVATPNLQRLAEQGVLFRQAFCAAPTCSPSRAALVTGQSPHSCGMLGLAHRGAGFRLNDYGRHVSNFLRRNGYFSALIGREHVAKDLGEVYDFTAATKSSTQFTHDVVGAAREFFAGPLRQPFYLEVGFNQTHREFPAPALAQDARYCLPPAPLPDTPATRRDMAAYKASAAMLDAGMGAVIAALDDAGLGGNTLVICTTDHGIAFPAMKCNLTDHGIGVMLIMRGPGGFAGGRAVDAMVSHIDIFPTLCELIGVDGPDWLQGRSMMPLIQGSQEQINEQVFAEVTYHAAYEPQRAVRTGRWKYIRRFDGRRHPILPNCDDSPSKDLWLEAGWRDMPPAAEQLYDLVFDPNEAHNLVGDPSRSAVLEDMRRRLDKWMRQTDDPLLAGPVTVRDTQVNDPAGLSPKDPLLATTP